MLSTLIHGHVRPRVTEQDAGLATETETHRARCTALRTLIGTAHEVTVHGDALGKFMPSRYRSSPDGWHRAATAEGLAVEILDGRRVRIFKPGSITATAPAPAPTTAATETPKPNTVRNGYTYSETMAAAFDFLEAHPPLPPGPVREPEAFRVTPAPQPPPDPEDISQSAMFLQRVLAGRKPKVEISITSAVHLALTNT